MIKLMRDRDIDGYYKGNELQKERRDADTKLLSLRC